MKTVLSITACLAYFLSGSQCDDSVSVEWESWKEKFGKEYGSIDEEMYRYGVWKDNLEMINNHNKMKYSYTLGMNQFGDLTSKEFRYHVHGHNGSCLEEFNEFATKEKLETVNPGLKYKSMKDLPDSVDWTETDGYVTPIKDQGSCGSCWAFSAVSSVESRYAIAKSQLNSLSEQELVDCSSLNAGCDGGNMDTAFYYVKQHSGLALESDYVYTAEDGTCESDKYEHYDAISGFKLVEHDNATALMAAVVEGPVSIGIQADQFSFQFYSGGILDGRCGTDIDHGVVVVGYGEDDGDKYWKVRNSWGDTWGEDGYVRICRECDKNDGEGECCILCQPSFPTVDE